jgi:phosphatidate cytidylyltransferase
MAQLLAERLDRALPKRVLSAAVLATLALASIWLGGWAFAALVALAIVAMAREWGDLVPEATRRDRMAAALAAGAIPVAAIVLVSLGEPWVALLAILLGAALVGGAALAAQLPRAGHVAAGVLYIGIPAVAIVWLDAVPGRGGRLVLWLLLVVWATDVFAFLVGRTLGGAKLAPRVSPGKTWSGLAGGVAGAAVVGAAASLALGGVPILAGLLAAGLAVIGQLGDLFESALKRRRGVKDSGRLIPGHGGILDRVDGLLFATPAYAAAVALAMPVVLE